MAKRPFSVTLSVAALASLSESSDSHTLDNGDVFVAESITAEVLGPLTGITQANKVHPLLLVNFRNGSAGAPAFSERTPLSCVAGDAKQPFILTQPIKFNSQPFMEVQNISTDTSYARVFVVLHGYRETAGE